MLCLFTWTRVTLTHKVTLLSDTDEHIRKVQKEEEYFVFSMKFEIHGTKGPATY